MHIADAIKIKYDISRRSIFEYIIQDSSHDLSFNRNIDIHEVSLV